MTRVQAIRRWKVDELPAVRAQYERDGVPDYPARAESWNNFTDALRGAGQITASQYDNWSHPSETSSPAELARDRSARRAARAVPR